MTLVIDYGEFFQLGHKHPENKQTNKKLLLQLKSKKKWSLSMVLKKYIQYLENTLSTLKNVSFSHLETEGKSHT